MFVSLFTTRLLAHERPVLIDEHLAVLAAAPWVAVLPRIQPAIIPIRGGVKYGSSQATLATVLLHLVGLVAVSATSCAQQLRDC